MLSRPAFGQESQEPRREGPGEAGTSQRSANGWSSRGPFSNGCRTPVGEEMRKIMEEQAAQHRNRAIEDLKGQLGVSDREWSVVRPRVETVYDLVHPRYQSAREAPDCRAAPVDQRTRALARSWRTRSTSEKIKTALTATRSPRRNEARQELVKARQDLRQIMTLRQEAVLVLNGLLD